MSSNESHNNLDILRDCLSGPLVQRSAVENARTKQKRKSRGRKNSIKNVKIEAEANEPIPSDAEELADFVDV